MKRLIKVNPELKPATWEQIRDKRDELRYYPITLADGRTFDYNKDTIDLMPNQIRNFATLPTLDALGRLPWKMSNNDYAHLTLTELTALYEELEFKRSQRVAKLQVIAEQLKEQQATVREINDLETWGL